MEQLGNSLPTIQIVLSVILATLILFQQSEGGLGNAFGGMGGAVYEKRGLEKYLFWGTAFVSILFVVAAIISLLLPA
ncbi:MAG: preprotein translocase subunit SecG [Candidatus Vogelbacteria bacterium]|nr:preprotein translocase subunit SecG [Candidatus Vogelbacteria bacterium]